MIASLSTKIQRILLTAGLVMVSGCATTSGDPRDPLEGFNRGVYTFNQTADEYVINPVARGYNTVTPEIVDEGVTNFFSNLGEIANFANNLLQLKIDEALSTATRFVFNSTFGIGGFFDVSTPAGLPRYSEDFGQTLGYWGLEPGPYLVLPLLGPSSVRDSGGLVADSFMNPIVYIDDDALRYSLIALAYIDVKSDLLDSGDLLREAALDEYDFVKNAYLDRRRGQIADDTGGGASGYPGFGGSDYEDDADEAE